MKKILISTGLIFAWVAYFRALVVASIYAHDRWWEPLIIPLIDFTMSFFKYSFLFICVTLFMAVANVFFHFM
jgi:hypothetical protein